MDSNSGGLKDENKNKEKHYGSITSSFFLWSLSIHWNTILSIDNTSIHNSS